MKNDYSDHILDDRSPLARQLGDELHTRPYGVGGLDRLREPFTAEEAGLAFCAALQPAEAGE